MTDTMTLRDERMNQVIELQTESENNVPGFVLGNALCPVCNKPTPPNADVAAIIPEPCDCDPPTIAGRHPVVQKGEGEGRELAIVGAGPSLAGFRPYLQKFKGEVWGANRGLNYLHEWGVTKAKGVAIDPFTRMFGKVWANPPETDYLLATSVNPGLVWMLEEHGYPIRYFHSYRGAQGETDLYHLLYPPTVLAGHGLNVVNRAIDVAQYMGFSRITVIGADNCLGDGDAFYAGGEKGETEGDVTLEGVIDGKQFRTKTDMLMSAVELVRKKKELKAEGVKLVFLGNTLPKALEGKPEAYLRRVIDWK